MPDFTSALYLGFEHPYNQLHPWRKLSFGKPAVLKETYTVKQAGHILARLQGQETALLAPSTLHLFWDLMGLFHHDRYVLLVDSHLYPVAKAGVDRAKSLGIEIVHYSHQNQDHLRALMKNKRFRAKRPVVITDGWCPRCGKPAPLVDYLDILRPFRGILIIDDTQALGIFGHKIRDGLSYGYGGGGLIPWTGIYGENVIVISSLAKGLGVPVAVISASQKWIERFENKSLTRMNFSPVSNAHLSATVNAIKLNEKKGESARRQLYKNVEFFRRLLSDQGIRLKGGIFPVQSWELDSQREAIGLHFQMKKKGITTAVAAPHLNRKNALLFLIRANHSIDEIERSAFKIGVLINLKSRKRNYYDFTRRNTQS